MSPAKVIETIGLAISQLLMNKLRAALTMLGIVIGVAAVVVLVSLGQGVQNFIISSLNQFGSQFIIVTGTTNNTQLGGAADILVQSSLTEADLDALSDPAQVPDVQKVAYMLTITQPVSYDGETVQGSTAGVSLDYLDILQFDIASGRGFNEADMTDNERVALVGPEIVQTTFDSVNPVGEALRIGAVNFRIVGVLEPAAASLPGLSGDDSILVPVTTAQRRLSGGRTLSGDYPVTVFMLEARDEESVSAAVDQIADALIRSHDLGPDDPADFQIIAQQAIVDSVSAITGLLTAFLAAIAGISLLVGGIGIMNIMLVTVTERTREIGLRKAVGAQQEDILAQFLLEAVTLAVIGGLIGTAVAMAATWVAGALLPDLNVSVQFSSVLLAVAISVLVGAFFGAFPANRAAGMNPIDALRYE